MTITFPGSFDVVSIKNSNVLLSVILVPGGELLKLGKRVFLGQREVQAERRVTSDLMGSVHPLVRGLQPGRGASEVTLQAFPSVLGDARDTK